MDNFRGKRINSALIAGQYGNKAVLQDSVVSYGATMTASLDARWKQARLRSGSQRNRDVAQKWHKYGKSEAAFGRGSHNFFCPGSAPFLTFYNPGTILTKNNTFALPALFPGYRRKHPVQQNRAIQRQDELDSRSVAPRKAQSGALSRDQKDSVASTARFHAA